MLSAAIVLACLSAAPALAHDETAFSGPFVGVTLGYDSVHFSYDGDGASKSGFLYGGTAGYDYNFGHVVVGVEAEVAGSTTKQDYSDVLVSGDSARLSAGRDLYAGMRVGVPVARTLLVYAKGGYTNARATASYDDGAGYRESAGENLEGYRLGGGLEWSRGNQMARIEYRYSDYGHSDLIEGLSTARHQIVLTTGLRF